MLFRERFLLINGVMGGISLHHKFPVGQYRHVVNIYKWSIRFQNQHLHIRVLYEWDNTKHLYVAY
jgi:hypothetical protein